MSLIGGVETNFGINDPENDMAYNEELDEQIKKVVARWKNTTSKKMFGGVCHLINGNMFCGVHKDSLILRLGEEIATAALTAAHVRPFDITGKAMKGWLMVVPEGVASDEELKYWIEEGVTFARSLPPK